MCITVLTSTALSALEKKTVAERAKSIIKFDGVELHVVVGGRFDKGIVFQLVHDRTVFTRKDLEDFAHILHVTPEFLLRPGILSEEEMDTELSNFEKRQEDEQGQRNQKKAG